MDNESTSPEMNSFGKVLSWEQIYTIKIICLATIKRHETEQKNSDYDIKDPLADMAKKFLEGIE
jgi:hypothetical protein